MASFNRQVVQDDPDSGEIDGLFCEEVLREWLQNLETLVHERDDSNPAAVEGRSQKGSSKTPPLKVVP